MNIERAVERLPVLHIKAKSLHQNITDARHRNNYENGWNAWKASNEWNQRESRSVSI